MKRWGPGSRVGLFAAVLLAGWPCWRWLSLRLSAPGEVVPSLLAITTAVGIVLAQRDSAPALPMRLRACTVLLLLYAALFFTLPPLGRAAVYVIALATFLPNIAPASRRTWWIAGLFLLALPVIPSLQFLAGFPLRRAVAEGAALLLRMQGLRVGVAGVALMTDESQLVSVDAPCSGVRMLWAGVYLATSLAAWRGLTLRRGALLIGAAVVFVVAGNILRATALYYGEAGLVAFPSWMHSAVGLVAFGGSAAGIAASFRLVERGRACAGC